jgi:hypothetical protein
MFSQTVKEFEDIIYARYSGNSNRKARKELMDYMNKKKNPIAKCGVHALIEEFKRIKEDNNGITD